MLPVSIPLPPGHNGGPPLDDPRAPQWGSHGIGKYFEWKAATRAAWNDVPFDIARMRARRAQALGLTYSEYTLEILERGRYLQAGDTERIAQIKRRRPVP
ncbi:hypothetical protein [uncultured Devosia sp.]|uniref:hypothetical protein n=1 Tax=uncultured Devosia sp. TaxID=211434 RepID=UPI0035CA4D1B